MKDVAAAERRRFHSWSASVLGSSWLWHMVLCVLALTWEAAPLNGVAQADPSVKSSGAVTFPANFDGGFRKTQFYAPNYDTGVGQWDSRVELWLPPRRGRFSWGPYVRIAGIAGSQSDAWQNEWISAPGAGMQLFPFSGPRFRGEHSAVGAWLGPLRAFGEYNFNHYWGSSNTWRPRNQVLTGFDYWKAAHVNDLSRAWWTEIWNGLYWQSSNEFTDRYDSIVFANSVRIGARAPGHGMLSALTPYLLAQSSRTKYNKPGETTDFYWENSFIGGGGMRVAPSLHVGPEGSRGITRFVVYGEYLNTAVYYGPVAPPTVPRYDIRVGVGVSIADWFK
jgi:hypothetical protein